MNVNQRSMLEVTIELMSKKKKPQKMVDLIKETLQLKGFDDNSSLATQLYIDITTSSLFVYKGEGLWNLKSREDISEYDKDGASFSTGVFEDDEDEIVTADDYTVVDEDDEIENVKSSDDDDDDEVVVAGDEDEDEIDLDVPFIPYSTDDDDNMNDKFLDEDKYNDYMDDYEELYDDK